MSKKTKPAFSPATCTESQLCRIKRDNFDVGNFTIMTDAHKVWLSEQPMGGTVVQQIGMTRSTFNKLVRWYLRPQKAIRKS